ncbi:SOSS complex subunit C homolog [Actinia tenebrosa]|uniref:SOSS complex subunit C homolog n=1 Tax=Actinia tenebrosa TaxID=6105 RepID=A0A6P8IEX2_ACTTE|nr:SOSS complex subunit C homolog [Actinia tenebrosa]
MAFQPHGNQEVQNRKILQDLQERRRQMMSQAQQAVTGTTGTNAGPSHVNRPGQEVPVLRNPGENHQLALSQRQALEQAHLVSPGFYVCQDSLFGNLIIPVIPRVDNDS